MVIKSFGSQKESNIITLDHKEKFNPILQYDINYDSRQPIETIRDFVADIRNMNSKYEYDKMRLAEIENELNDLFHYAEMADHLPAGKGYRVYRKIAALRKERRACKNEMDLLWPVYEYFHATEVLGRLSKVQGECGKLKETIDDRSYMCRTDVLKEFMDEPKKDLIPDETTIDIPDGLDVLEEAN